MKKLICAHCNKVNTETEMYSAFSFMRHGRTQMNEDNLTVGSIDEPINKTGIRQAEEAARRFAAKGIRFDVIVSSPMIRAVKTAEIIAKELGIGIVTENRLRERKSGILEGQPETPESDSLLLRYDFQPEGMEPLKEFEKETEKFLIDSAVKYAGKNILFVTHGFRMLTIIKLIRGWGVGTIMRFTAPTNCEIIEFHSGDACPLCGSNFYYRA